MIQNAGSGTATVLLSGGIDSIACAHYLKSRGTDVRALHVGYGQAAELPEREAAESLSRHFGFPIDFLLARGVAPLGPGEVVGRNAFLVLGALTLGRISAGMIALGIHSGTRYYDCSPAFLDTVDRLVAEYTDGLVRVCAPFLDWTKQQVVDYARRSELPIGLSYSCEAGTLPPCGSCLSCRDRRALGCFT
jgi:7-cyano-7-deazaguanine synthase